MAPPALLVLYSTTAREVFLKLAPSMHWPARAMVMAIRSLRHQPPDDQERSATDWFTQQDKVHLPLYHAQYILYAT